MTKVFHSYSMDFTSRREYARRDDGQWFLVPSNLGAGRDRPIRLPK